MSHTPAKRPRVSPFQMLVLGAQVSTGTQGPQQSPTTDGVMPSAQSGGIDTQRTPEKLQ